MNILKKKLNTRIYLEIYKYAHIQNHIYIYIAYQ